MNPDDGTISRAQFIDGPLAGQTHDVEYRAPRVVFWEKRGWDMWNIEAEDVEHVYKCRSRDGDGTLLYALEETRPVLRDGDGLARGNNPLND